VGSTQRAGDMPDTIIDLLERQWEATSGSPAMVAALRRWGSEDEVLGQFSTVAALFSYVACRARPVREREDVLCALACRAAADGIAAQLLLQLLMPRCKSLVASFAWLGDSAGELAADVIGDVWSRICAMPASPRPEWVAMPALDPARKQLQRRARQRKREALGDVTTHLTASQLLATERGPSAAEELAAMLRDANKDGVLTDDQARLIWSYRVEGVTPVEAAKHGGVSPVALERRRLRAELRLRQSYGVAACA
jgi:DNA-directed RNA polymerase specialized sigma24 family protein